MAKSKKTKEYNRMVKEYKHMADIADRRLRRLEKLSQQKGFEAVEQYAYKKAMKDIRHWTGEGSTRFKRGVPTSMQSLKAKMRDIQEFLSAATSTKGGIKKVYKKRADTINKKFGTNFTWQEMGDYMSSSAWEKHDSEYGSQTALMAIGEIQGLDDQTIERIRSGRDANLHISNAKVEDAVYNMLRDRNIDVMSLI